MLEDQQATEEEDERTRYVGATLFSITGSCRNCPVSTSGTFNLFDDTFRRALLSSPSKRQSRSTDSLGDQLQIGDSCVCPVGREPEVDQGPSASEFESVFIEELAELEEERKEEGKPSSVAVTATSIAEGHEVDCSPDVREFQSATYTDLGVDPANLSAEERKILEDSFIRAYNSLSFSACDGYFSKHT